MFGRSRCSDAVRVVVVGGLSGGGGAVQVAESLVKSVGKFGRSVSQ